MTDKVEKAVNYTPELQARLVELYDGGKGNIDEIAKELNRSKKSVIGKLVNLKVYVKPVQAPKTFAETGPSKKEILKGLEALGFSEAAVKGLGNATKDALAEVKERVESAKAIAEAA